MKTRKSFWYRTSALSTVLYHSTISLRRVVRSTAWESFVGDIRRAPLSLADAVLTAHPPCAVSQILCLESFTLTADDVPHSNNVRRSQNSPARAGADQSSFAI